MNILLAIIALTGFVTGVVSLAVAAYTKYAAKAQISAMLAEAQAESAGIELRLEHLLQRRLSEASLEIRQQAQSDSAELVNSMLGRDPQSQGGDPFSMGNFSNFGT